MADDETYLTLHLTVTAEQGAPRVPLKLSKKSTPTELRREASETTKIPLQSLKLIFRGRLIGDDDSKEAATEYKLEDGSVIHCMGKPMKDGSDETASETVSSTIPATMPSGPTVTILPTASAAAPPSLPVPVSSSIDPVTSALQYLRTHNPPAVYETAVSTLEKILSNIVQNPLEEKYRRVKINNAAFQRRLGGITGGAAAMKACGFIIGVDDGEEVYSMHASAEAWVQLLAAIAKVEEAAKNAKEATNSAPTPSQPVDLLRGLPGGASSIGIPAMSPSMQSAMSNVMSDPAQLQAIMQNPMIQQAMLNDPRMSNDPMMQQTMQEIATNPALANRVSQMLRDPSVLTGIQSLMQASGGNLIPPAGLSSAIGNTASQQQASSTANGTSGAGRQPDQNSSGASDENMTEEDMIAEAIRRSLQDS